MTVATSGMTGTFWVCATQGGTYVKLAELSDLKIKIDGKDIDTSNVDDAGWGSSISGAKSFDVTPKSNLILSDTAYGIMIAALLAGTTIYMKALQSGTPTSSPVGFAGPVGVSSTTLVLAATNAQQSGDWSLKGRGALTQLP